MEIPNPFTDSAVASSRVSSIQEYPLTDHYSTVTRPILKRRFKSYLLTGEYERPWLNDKRLKKSRTGNYIIWGFIVAGLALSGYINYSTVSKIPKHSVCSTGFAFDVW
jgi:hypothetical protein